METVIFAHNMGLGLILNKDEEEHDFIDPQPILLAGEVLEPEVYTTINNMYDQPMLYMGLLKSELEKGKKIMVFYLGEKDDMFEPQKLYMLWYYLSDTRIVNKYAENSARDYNWNGTQWK